MHGSKHCRASLFSKMDAYLKGSSLMITWQSSRHFASTAFKLQILVGSGHTLPLPVKVSLNRTYIQKLQPESSIITRCDWMSSLDDRPRRAVGSSGWASVLGPDMTLDIHTLLEKLPEAHRDAELKQVSTAFTSPHPNPPTVSLHLFAFHTVN